MQEHHDSIADSKVLRSEGDNSNMATLPYKVLTVGLSDIGLVRQNNEDIWVQQPSIGLYILADGMGGHQAGEVASRETALALCKILKKKIASSKHYTLLELQDLLKRAIVYVNGLIFKMSRANYELKGMGTTLCCLLFHPDGLVFAHVGDSRIYRLRNGKFEQLTKDHSLFRDLVDQGQLNASQACDFLYKNIITKAIGTEQKVEPTVKTCSIHSDDIFLMCSDGLSDLLTAIEIREILLTATSKEAAANMLVARANAEGGKDNITVVITKIKGTDVSKKDLSRQ
jgi:serine/threonine protein phosphatase PrpC